VEIVKRERDLGCVELGYRVGKSLTISNVKECPTYLALAQQAEQFSSGNEIHDHVKVVHILKSAPKVDEERVADAHEHFTFRVGVLDLLHFDDFLLI
jgi:hypothetical protein